MTGIQALERIAPGLPMKPGKVERCELEYRRHGTQTLIAGFDVTIGKVVGVIGDTRTEQDFARFLDTLLSSAAAGTPITSIGVPLGENSPNHSEVVNSGSPISAKVGMPGNSVERTSPATAYAFMLPACRSGNRTAPVVPNINSIRPAIKSCI